MNTPFLIFNQDADIFALIDYDLPLQIIGYKPHLKVEIEHYDVIQQGFNDVMQRYGSYTNMPNLFRTYYDFLLPEWFEYWLGVELFVCGFKLTAVAYYHC